MNWYPFADTFLFVFHLVFILFNLTGWYWRPLRRLHLVAVLLTLASWFILGIFYGLGYCPLTDWHWAVLRQMGRYDLPASYVSYLLQRAFGLYLRDSLVDAFTLAGAIFALIMSVWANFFQHSKNSLWQKTKDKKQ